MKRCLAVFLLLIFLLCGCTPQTEDLPEVLVTVDGKAVLTRTDYLFAQEYEGIDKKDARDAEDLFLRLAADAVCSHIAAEYGEGESLASIQAEYEIFLETLEETAQEENFLSLRESLSQLSDSQFDSAYVNYLYRTASSAALQESIEDEYGNVSDPETIREGILANLWELSESYEILLFYPDMEQNAFDFNKLS